MGKVQGSINQLIFQTALIKGMQDKKGKEESIAAKTAAMELQRNQLMEKKQAAADEALKGAQLKNQTAEQKLKNEQLKGQISQQRLEQMQAKATASANESIKAKYTQRKNYKERYTAAQRARMDLTAPHKPLPKVEIKEA